MTPTIPSPHYFEQGSALDRVFPGLTVEDEVFVTSCFACREGTTKVFIQNFERSEIFEYQMAR